MGATTDTANKKKGGLYQAGVTVAGLALWVGATGHFALAYPLRDQLIVVVLALATIILGVFLSTLPLPSGLKFTDEKVSLTLSDAVILLAACWYGLPAAVFIAGIEGFTSSRRTTRRVASNLFSAGMLTTSAAIAAICLYAMLRYGFGESGRGLGQRYEAVALAIFAACVAHTLVNWGLLSILLALRHGQAIASTWREKFLWAIPMFLPNAAAATMTYIALHYNPLLVITITVPLLTAIYLGQRQSQSSVRERIESMAKAHKETIEALAVAINAKDKVTHEHVLRVQIYSAGVARILGCTAAEVEALKAGALLHDIGKLAVPDHILNKPGKLTAAEFEKMKMHTIAGAQILSRVEFPYPVVPVVRHHHERWDGRGYPDGLKGEEIPLTARILSVVDCFDAVREDRQYRRGLSREEAINLIMEGSGTQYDPRVVGTFITHLPVFEAEILAMRDAPVPTFGIEPTEELSEAARAVAPAAGLAQEETAVKQGMPEITLTRAELRTLSAISEEVNMARSRDRILSSFAARLGSLVPYDSCAITLIAAKSGQNEVVYAAGRHAGLLQGRCLAQGEGVTGWVLANGQPFCNTDPKLDLPPSYADAFAAYRTLAVFPVMNETEMLGAVALYSATLAQYDANQQKLMEEAVAILARALPAALSPASPPAEPAVKTPASYSEALESQLTH